MKAEDNKSSMPPLPFFKRVAAFILSLILRLICSTLRFEKIGLEVGGKHWSTCDPMILVFWHGDQLMMPWAYRSKFLKRGSKELHALVSMHNDGQIAAKTLSYLNIHTVNGSSTRGALRSLMHLRKKLKENKHIAITPDGPKGPANIAKNGAVILSSSGSAMLLPVTIVASSYWELRSWDKMFIPKPFSKVIILAAEPYLVKPSLSKEDAVRESEKLSTCLNNLKSTAQDMLNETLNPIRNII